MGDTAATTTANTTTNTLHLSSATLTIRLIKSFEYRTVKNLILNGIDLTTVTPAQLKAVIAQSKKLSNIAIFTALVIFNAIIEIQSTSSLKPYLNNTFDTLKIYTKAHGSKTQNLVINFDHEDNWYLTSNDTPLIQLGIENETEISFFNKSQYETYKNNPEIKW